MLYAHVEKDVRGSMLDRREIMVFTVDQQPLIGERAQVEIVREGNAIRPGEAGRAAWHLLVKTVCTPPPDMGPWRIEMIQPDNYTVVVYHEAGQTERAVKFGLAVLKVAAKWMEAAL